MTGLSVSFRIQAEGRDKVLCAFGVLQVAILVSNKVVGSGNWRLGDLASFNPA